MPRICFVLCYIGPLPRYFSTFLATCEWNHDVDFLIASDQPAPRGVGSNIRWVTTTTDELRHRFSEAVGFPASLPSGYKLCDYKPVLGQAFARELEGYDFWGFCDPDLVWGHIRSFATPERLSTYDILTFRGRQFISGPCTLIRNTPALNALYAESPSIERAFQTPTITKFTEWGGGKRERKNLNEILESGRLVSFTDVARWEEEEGRIRWLDNNEIAEHSPRRRQLLFEWRLGHLYRILKDENVQGKYREREILFYHYVAAKDYSWFYIPERSDLPESFRITERGAFVPSIRHARDRLVFEARRFASGVPRAARRLERRVRSRLARNIQNSRRRA